LDACTDRALSHFYKDTSRLLIKFATAHLLLAIFVFLVRHYFNKPCDQITSQRYNFTLKHNKFVVFLFVSFCFFLFQCVAYYFD